MTDKLTIKYKIQLKTMQSIAKAMRFFGFKVTYAVASFFGLLAWYLLPKRRKLAIYNIEKHLGVNQRKATEIAKKSFKENFCSFAEILLTQCFESEIKNARLKFVNPENWEKIKCDERPVVGVTGHFGSWELLAGLLGGTRKNDIPRLVVVRKYPNMAVDNFITEQRQVSGGTVIGHRMAAPAVLRALKKNGLVAFLVDHKPSKGESIELPFFNAITDVNMGPALLAIRGKALIIPIFLNRSKDDYTCYVYDPLDTKELVGSNEEKIAAATLFYTRAVEEHVRAFPEQWFWMHDRWKEFKLKKVRGTDAKENAS